MRVDHVCVKKFGAHQTFSPRFGWLKKAFGERMWDITLPESTLIKTASAMLQTIYDVTDKKEMQKQSYKRYKEPMDMLVDLIAAQFNADWSKP